MQTVVDGFAARVSDYADGIAQRLGQPLSGQQLSKDEAIQRWNFSPLGSTQAADAQYHQLVATGTPPGQALAQVYPMRPLLIQGSDVNDSIARAKQIAGWAADAAGQPPPQPFEGSTLPLSVAQQQQAPPPAAVMPGMPPPLQAGPPPGIGPGPAPGLPLPVAPPAPGPLPGPMPMPQMPPGPMPGPMPMPVT
jgi:hypothetical protein